MKSDKSHSLTVADLPNFCQSSTVYLTMIAGMLLAFILSLAEPQWHSTFWYHFTYYSIFILWTGLFSLGLLCLLRRKLEHLSLKMFSFVGISIIITITLLFSIIITAYLTERPSEWFLFRNASISLVVSGVFFRYLFLRQDSLRRIKSEAEARVQALQSRIRPHFLFNSLNTLANLAAINPDKTEQLILDMADIFRASMQRSDVLIPFSEEKSLCEQYLRLEQQRLGDKLQCAWRTETINDSMRVPPLLLQPLLENAVYHGVQARPDGGSIIIKGISYQKYIQIEITNPMPPVSAELHKGNSLALSNIRQRLEVLYGNKASLNSHQANDVFYCILKIPKDMES